MVFQIQWKKDEILDIWFWDNWLSTWKKIMLDSNFKTYFKKTPEKQIGELNTMCKQTK